MGPVDVVISGIGGRFPRSKNISEFNEHLLAGKSLLEPINRWNPGWGGTPKMASHIDSPEKFDNTFFGMHYVLSTQTDPIARVSMENAFEALVDAGVTPSSLRGTNAQVYSSNFQFESDPIVFSALGNGSGYTIMGRNRCMIANRISYWLGLHGRSCAYEGTNGWVGVGLDLALKAIQGGECDSALILGSSLMITKETCKQKQMFGLLSQDSASRPLDADADGYARGEAQVCFLVQRADIAKRSYGTIVAAGAEHAGHLPSWFLSVNEDHFRRFVTTLYHENGLDPTKVKLLEADGLCNKEMVEAELNILDDIFNTRRKKDDPLFLGSVKTIVGETEGAAGHVSLTKVLLALDTGIISPTLRTGKLNPNIIGLTEGRFKVLNEPTKWDVTPDTHVAISCLSTNGVVAHVAVRANVKAKKTDVNNDYHLPYLLLISGRNEDTVENALQTVAESPFDPEYLRLTQEFFVPTIDKYEWRGYGFHGDDKFIVQRENRRPVWFVFSGMGSQWTSMGKELISIPIMKETFQRLQSFLQPKGVDLIGILTNTDQHMFDNILHSFVGITAVQIAFTNLLHELGIKPDGMIGHSVGELGCSYADGCLTEEETILTSYSRGEASLKAKLVPGLMAAVGLGYDQVKNMLPPEVVVACHNSNESCTLSGPTEAMKNTIQDLKEKNIFVRSVNVSNIAYHSPYIRPAAPYLLNSLRKIITKPKLRSSKWICTSVPKDKWDSDEVRYCSAEYHTNNLLNSVYFEEGAASIPKNALAIEIAPHGLLQPILKRSLGQDVANVALAKRGATNGGKTLLEALGKYVDLKECIPHWKIHGLFVLGKKGNTLLFATLLTVRKCPCKLHRKGGHPLMKNKLFLEGLSPEIWRLYPDVSMPVSRNTPSLIPLIGWQHDNFSLTLKFGKSEDTLSVEMDISSPHFEIAGVRKLLPSFALVHAWRIFGQKKEENLDNLPLILEDIFFHDLIELKTEEKLELVSSILPETGHFEITLKDAVVITGKIRALDRNDYKPYQVSGEVGPVQFSLTPEDVYAEMNSRNVSLRDSIKCLKNIEVHPKDWVADIEFDGDWVRLLTSLLVLFQLPNQEGGQGPVSVRHIQKLVIDPVVEIPNDNKARLHLPSSTLTYGGIQLQGVDFENVGKPCARSDPFSLQFIPYGLTSLKNEDGFLSHVVHLSLEKRFVPVPIYKIYDVDGSHSGLASKLQRIVTTEWSFNCEIISEARNATIVLCGAASIPDVAPIVAEEGILLLSRCVRTQRPSLDEALAASGFLALAESQVDEMASSLVVASSQLPPVSTNECKIIKMGVGDGIPTSLGDSLHRIIILVWENGHDGSIEKLYKELTTVHYAEKIRLVFLMSSDAPPFSLSVPLYANQIRRNVPVNVYVDGEWGGYIITPLPEQQRPRLAEDVDIKSDIVANGNGPIRLNYIGLSNQRSTTNDMSSLIYKGVLDYSGECDGNQRVMGLAYYDEPSGLFKRDPHFAWTIPDGWSLEEAATVPCAYANMYYSLLEIVQLRAKESVLITCPLTPAGQAAVRIALTLNCDVFVLAGSSEESQLLQDMFPLVPPSRVVTSSSDTFVAHFNKERSPGVKLVITDFTGNRLTAATQCLACISRLVHTGVESLQTHDAIGMNFFLKSTAVHGAIERRLLTASLEIKKQIAAWVKKGIEDNVVCPNQIRRKLLSKQIFEAARVPKGGDVHKRVVCLQEGKGSIKRRSSITMKDPGECSVIVGGSKTQWIRMVHWLAHKGCKHIYLALEQPAPNSVARHAQILQQYFHAELTVLRNFKSGADLVDQVEKAGNIQAVFILSQNKLAEDVVTALSTRGLNNTPVISFSEGSNHFTRMCERWAKAGLKVRAVLGVDDVYKDAAMPLLDWLLSSVAPPVIIFRGPVLFFKRKEVSLKDTCLLPSSLAELRALGAELRGKTEPGFRELITRCTKARHTAEVQPLFFIKGIHGTAGSELVILASGLLSPMFEVTLPIDCDALEATAKAVINGIQKIQPRGPYNLAGDAIRTNVVTKIASILEEQGHASVVFLLDEQINAIREELKVLQTTNNLNIFLLKFTIFEDVAFQHWKSVEWGKLSWSEQVSAVVSKVYTADDDSRQDVIAALEHVKNSVSHITQGEERVELSHGIVRSLKKGEEYRENERGEGRFTHVVPWAKLKNKDLADVYGANIATPVLQLNINKARAKKQAQCSENPDH